MKCPVDQQRWKMAAPAAVAAVLLVLGGSVVRGESPIRRTIDQVQPKIVKVYGAGGFRGLEGYQSGLLISAEGHVLTAHSAVLDTSRIRVTLGDGRRFQAKMLGADPRLEIALLKIEATGLPYFDLDRAPAAKPGTRVLAFSNLFGIATGREPASVLHGSISVVTRLDARRGTFDIPYNGPVYLLDMTTNNPGAAGGALVDYSGELLGVLGKELRNRRNNTWINYALPVDRLRPSVEAILSGKTLVQSADPSRPKPEHPLTLEALGLVLVPDVVARTPPYVDQVRRGSPAAAAGVRPDDLIVLFGDRLISSSASLREAFQYTDALDPVRLTLLRGQELIEMELEAARKENRDGKQ